MSNINIYTVHAVEIIYLDALIECILAPTVSGRSLLLSRSQKCVLLALPSANAHQSPLSLAG